MQYRVLGKANIKVSSLSFGASALGGVFRPVVESEAVAAVHAALDLGINYFDVAPAYGGTLAEAVLGRALAGIPRRRYFLSTKVGKHTNLGKYGDDILDYSRQRIRLSLDESARRLGVEYFDLVHLHDFEYQHRRHAEWALSEGLAALHELKREGRIGAVGCGIYPMDLWHRLIADCDIDAGLVHNHHCLNDVRLLELLPMADRRNIGLINAAPFASGLLTEHGPADWHPAPAAVRAVFQAAAVFCQAQGTSLSKLALQFASQNPAIPTTMFSSASVEMVRANVAWHEEPLDAAMASEVRKLLAPVSGRDWSY